MDARCSCGARWHAIEASFVEAGCFSRGLESQKWLGMTQLVNAILPLRPRMQPSLLSSKTVKFMTVDVLSAVIVVLAAAASNLGYPQTRPQPNPATPATASTTPTSASAYSGL